MNDTMKKIHYYIQRVMSELRTAQLKDQAAGLGNGYVMADKVD